MSVIDFAEEKLKRGPHVAGPCKCLECGHEWEAVRPLGDCWWLECPSCGLEKGRPIGPYLRDAPHWLCNCGNDLFHITPNGAYCPHCNATMTLAELAE